MKKMFSSVAVVCAALMMASCGSGKNAVAVDLSGEWNIVEVNGQQLSGDSDPFIGFDMEGKRIYGNAGCNLINGGFETSTSNAKSISFPGVASTMMACPDMETEGKILKALNEVKSFDVLAGGGIGLYDANNALVIVLEKK